MEGSGSGSGKRGGKGVPPTVPRSSRRRSRENNPNEQNPEMPTEARRSREDNPNEQNPEMPTEANLQPQSQPQPQPQPKQVEAGGQIESADQRAREANRRYSETFRHRRQTHKQRLEALVQSLEAQVAQNKAQCERLTIGRSQDGTEIEALKGRREASAANLQAKEAERERIKDKMEKVERLLEANDQEMLNMIMNDPDFQFLEETFRAVIEALTPALPHDPPRTPAPGTDEAGPSGAQDSTSSLSSSSSSSDDEF